MLNKSIEGYDSYRADNKNDLTHKNDAKYIDMVMSLLECDASYKRRIKEDLYIMLEEKRVQKGGLAAETRITSYNVCYTKLLRDFKGEG